MRYCQQGKVTGSQRVPLCFRFWSDLSEHIDSGTISVSHNHIYDIQKLWKLYSMLREVDLWWSFLIVALLMTGDDIGTFVANMKSLMYVRA